jgi:hypothetical protein
MLLITAVKMKGEEGGVVMLFCHLIESLQRERHHECDFLCENSIKHTLPLTLTMRPLLMDL